MKIEKININAYGKLENKEITLKDGINLIKGENESGKSTLLSYIISSFFGLSKLKENKEISDYEKYKPWSGKEFSGSISYELDNKEKYEVFRKFDNKNAIIYNSNKEDISKTFEVSKKDGNKFFTEQTGLNKEMYISSIISTQGEVRLDQNSQNSIVQKISNIAGTGDDSISYEKVVKKLRDKLNEEVGSSRTKDKPLNRLSDEEGRLKEKISEIRPYEDKKYVIDEYIETAEKEIEENEIKSKYLKEIEDILKNEREIIKDKEEDNSRMNVMTRNKNELLNQTKAIENESKEKLDEIASLDEKVSKIEIAEEGKHKKVLEIGGVILFVFLIAALVVHFTINIKIIKIVSIIIGAISILGIGVSGFILYKNKKIEAENIIKEREKNKLSNRINEIKLGMNETLSTKSKIDGQIELLEKQINELKGKIYTYSAKIEENKSAKQNIADKYKDKIEEEYLREITRTDNIDEKIGIAKEELLESKNQKNKLELEVDQVNKVVEEKVKLEERLKALEEEKASLEKRAEEIELASSFLRDAYDEMKTRITPKFTENLSKNIAKISDGKYNKVLINDEKGLIVQRDNGEYIDLNKLSVGTIDELYLSLRLTMVDDISKEKMPIMLDETFAYFDDKRLANTLKFLNNEIKNHQILLFTCTNREKEIMDKLNIKYNEVKL